jgi:hypothetical protein
MRLRLIALVLPALLLAACQSSNQSTMYVQEVTRVVTVVATAIDSGSVVAQANTPLPTATASTIPSQMPSSPTATFTPAPTTTPDVFPTPSIGEIFVAEQVFERGRMFWLEPVNQIWVITQDEEGRNAWYVFQDTYDDNEPESDPSLQPPAGLMQPIRGFGKLWRENQDIQDLLGWATDSELGYFTRYEFHAGGEVSSDNEYIPGPGYHLIETLDQQVIRFNEVDRTWQIVS